MKEMKKEVGDIIMIKKLNVSLLHFFLITISKLFLRPYLDDEDVRCNL